MSLEDGYSNPENSLGKGGPAGSSVSIPEAYILFWSNFANFRTRANRAEYWKVFLVNIALYLVLFALGVAGKVGLFLILYFIYALAALVPSLALTVRRLHDTDRSGGWIFISLVPLVGSIILIVFLILDSTPGPNRFGPPSVAKGISSN